MLQTVWCPQHKTDRQGQGLLAAGKTTGAAIGQNIVPKGSDGFPEAELGGLLQTFSSACLLSACILSHAVSANEVLGHVYILGGIGRVENTENYPVILINSKHPQISCHLQ